MCNIKQRTLFKTVGREYKIFKLTAAKFYPVKYLTLKPPKNLLIFVFSPVSELSAIFTKRAVTISNYHSQEEGSRDAEEQNRRNIKIELKLKNKKQKN